MAVQYDFGQIVPHCFLADIGYLTAIRVFADLGVSVKIGLCRLSQMVMERNQHGPRKRVLAAWGEKTARVLYPLAPDGERAVSSRHEWNASYTRTGYPH